MRKLLRITGIICLFSLLTQVIYSDNYVGGRKVIDAYKATIKKYLKVGDDSATTVDKSEDIYCEDDIECGGDFIDSGTAISSTYLKLDASNDPLTGSLEGTSATFTGTLTADTFFDGTLTITDGDLTTTGTGTFGALEVTGAGARDVTVTSTDHITSALNFIRTGNGYYDWRMIDSGGDLYFDASIDDGSNWLTSMSLIHAGSGYYNLILGDTTTPTVGGRLIAASQTYPVIQAIRDTTTDVDNIYGGCQLQRLMTGGTALDGSGIGFFFRTENDAGETTTAGMFGGALADVSDGAEIGEIVFAPAWQGADPLARRDLVLAATGAATSTLTLAGCPFVSDSNLTTTGELYTNDRWLADDSPKDVFRDTDDSVAYAWHLDTHTDNIPWQNFGLWRGTSDGTNFSVDPNKPLMYFDTNNYVNFPHGYGNGEFVKGILATGTTTGFTIPSGAGTRLMWMPAEGAFRAGRVTGTEWDDGSVGNYSVAMGYNTEASGDYSFAAGISTTASGDYSTAMGGYTTASGDYSTAMGRSTTASGNDGTAMGYLTTASGSQSTAMGSSTTASGSQSTAMGNSTTASGDYSTAMGYYTIASGYKSTAMGNYTQATADYSTAMGNYTQAESSAGTAFGRYNVGGGTANSWVATDPLFELGMGTADAARANALTVYKNGNMELAGDLTTTGIATVDKLIVDSVTEAISVQIKRPGASSFGYGSDNPYIKFTYGNTDFGSIYMDTNFDFCFDALKSDNGINFLVQGDIALAISQYGDFDFQAGNITTTGTLTVGVDDTGADVKFYGTSSGVYFLWDESEDELNLTSANLTTTGNISGTDGTFTGTVTVSNKVRCATADYRRYYHLPVDAFDPGASGATWVSANANHRGGHQLNAVGETLEFGTDVHEDWDGASDMVIEMHFALNASGSANDTVDLRLQCFYNSDGDTATKTQVLEEAVVTDGTQYKTYPVTFTINWDETDNNVELNDAFGFILNLETDTSEIDDIILLQGNSSYFYNTTHTGIEDGDT